MATPFWGGGRSGCFSLGVYSRQMPELGTRGTFSHELVVSCCVNNPISSLVNTPHFGWEYPGVEGGPMLLAHTPSLDTGGLVAFNAG